MSIPTEENEKFATALSLIEDLTSRCDEEQTRVLADILTRNAETEYLKRHGLGGATDRETFKSKVPVVNYEDIMPDIQRIADGDVSPILCAQPISQFYTSSGTSGGKRKLIPSTADNVAQTMQIYTLLTPIINSYMPGLDKGKALFFQVIKEETKTPGGLVASPATTSLFKSPYFANLPKDPHQIITSPYEAILCPDVFQSMYTQIICGLYDRLLVLRIGGFFPSGLLLAINFLRANYRDICHDISTGVLNPRITDEPLRACMSKIMRPDPELAGFIEHACGEEKWEGILTRIWPNTKYLSVTVSGSMAQYIPQLDYYSGGLPKVSTSYVSSECFFGINLKPFCEPSEISYTIFPNMGYFEFIPLDGPTQDSIHQPVDLANVEVGKEYEIVVTTYAGLYRYRVGDVLRVTGFHNSAPQFAIVRRNKVLLSIDFDKTDELQLQNAIEAASKLLRPSNTKIVEYTSYPDTKTNPGHYVIYWELVTEGSMNGLGPQVLEQCCLEMEEALDTVYRECRVVDRTVGPLEIRVVKNGTFEELMEYAISQGASYNQYKVPKCVNAVPMVELLESRVVSAHFSPSKPHWSPVRVDK